MREPFSDDFPIPDPTSTPFLCKVLSRDQVILSELLLWERVLLSDFLSNESSSTYSTDSRILYEPESPFIIRPEIMIVSIQSLSEAVTSFGRGRLKTMRLVAQVLIVQRSNVAASWIANSFKVGLIGTRSKKQKCSQ